MLCCATSCNGSHLWTLLMQQRQPMSLMFCKNDGKNKNKKWSRWRLENSVVQVVKIAAAKKNCFVLFCFLKCLRLFCVMFLFCKLQMSLQKLHADFSIAACLAIKGGCVSDHLDNMNSNSQFKVCMKQKCERQLLQGQLSTNNSHLAQMQSQIDWWFHVRHASNAKTESQAPEEFFKALRLWFSSVWHQCNVHVWQIEQIKKKIGCQKTCNQ